MPEVQASHRNEPVLRMLCITNTPPVPSWGGAMTFYRHFVERPEFEVAVATTDTAAIKTYRERLSYPVYQLRNGRVRDRLLRTRFGEKLHTRDHLQRGKRVSKSLLDFCSNFRPDAIFTVGGSWLWTARLASTVADRLNIPLIGSFNDWWSYNQIFEESQAENIEEEFRNFYRRCDLALCTSEGMQQELGPHPNSAIWYPTGAQTDQIPELLVPSSPYQVAFAGNLGEWYGTMVQQVIEHASDASAAVQFRIFGSRPNWSPSFKQEAEQNGTFRGQVSFDQLRREIREADALLLPMGFDASCELVERTSFKTKFLDYLAFGRPIIVWGPEYCSAVKVAREFDSAEVCTSPKPADAMAAIANVSQSVDRQRILVDNARKMYEDRFHPDKIHGMLVQRVRTMIQNGKKF